MPEPRKPYLVGLKGADASMAMLQQFVAEASLLPGANLKARRNPNFVTVQLTEKEVQGFRKKYGALLFEFDAPLSL